MSTETERTNREINEAVHEKVLGGGLPAVRYLLPHYTTDVAADYTVLEHVRATWGETRRVQFALELSLTWALRSGTKRRAESDIQYWVGDYARAALAVVEGKDER